MKTLGEYVTTPGRPAADDPLGHAGPHPLDLPTADQGLALAARAGAKLADLEFIQFHPTAFDGPSRPSGPADR